MLLRAQLALGIPASSGNFFVVMVSDGPMRKSHRQPLARHSLRFQLVCRLPMVSDGSIVFEAASMAWDSGCVLA